MGLLDFLEPLDYPRQAVYNLGAAGKHLLSGDSTWDDLLRAAPALLGGGLTAGLMATGVGAPLGILAGSVLGGLGQGAENAVDRARLGAPQVSELTKALGVDPESWPGMATTFGIGALTDPLSYASGLGLGRNLAERGAASEANALRASLIAKGAMPPEVAALTRAVDEAGNPLKLFHGTANVFDKYDMAKMSPTDLYGPGAYHTVNPDVSEGYAMGRAEDMADKRLQAERSLELSQEQLKHSLEGLTNTDIRMGKYRLDPFDYLPPDLASELSTHKVSKTLLSSLIHGYHEPGFGTASDYYQNYRQALDRFGLPTATQGRVEDWVKGLPEMAQRELETAQQELQNVWGKHIQQAEQTLANNPEPRANIRAHFLDVRQPFDIEAPVSREAYQKLLGELPPEALPVPLGHVQSSLYRDPWIVEWPDGSFRGFDSEEEAKAWQELRTDPTENTKIVKPGPAPVEPATPVMGHDVYSQLVERPENVGYGEDADKVYANERLKQAGYDAITHEGGGRAGGGRIMHDVWIALYPEQSYKPYVAPALRSVPRMSPLLSALLAQQGGARAYDLR